MRVAIHSASAAVARTLEALITSGGHTIATAANAEVMLRDTIHPKPPITTAARVISLVATPTNTTTEISCPIRPTQLLRVLANSSAPQPLALGGGWTVDTLARNLTHTDATPVTLTEKECTLLKTLATAYPNALGRDALLTDVWGITSAIDTHTLETHIYRLRAKLNALSPAAGDIVTEAGAYRLTMENTAKTAP